MIVTVLVAQPVELPDEELVRLAHNVRARLDLAPGTPVWTDDLLAQAMREGLLRDLGGPCDWEVDLDDQLGWTDQMLAGDPQGVLARAHSRAEDEAEDEDEDEDERGLGGPPAAGRGV